MAVKIPKRILTVLLNSLTAGVVPRAGAPYIAIGRTNEVASLRRDFDNICEGGASTRFIIGSYGSGKSFLIQLMRGYAAENGFITADADLSPERKLSSSGGGGLLTYRELIKNMSSKASPDGGAFPQMISKWISDMQYELVGRGISPEDERFSAEMKKSVYSVLHTIETGIGAFDFARVINLYYDAYRADDEDKKNACMRWFRGEYGTKTEAKAALGVSGIINDDNWYDYIKLYAAFSHTIGYKGLIVFIDECVNLYKIPNRISRESNYEKILSVFNDTLQGKAQYLGMIFAGTPQFLEDKRRGLFSYEALRSRLVDETLSPELAASSFGPVMRLRRLSDDELLALLARINNLFGELYGDCGVTGEEMKDFLYYMLSRAGADVLVTPREIIRGFMTCLYVLKENPEKRLPDVYKSAGTPPGTDGGAVNPDTDEPGDAGKNKTEKKNITAEDIII